MIKELADFKNNTIGPDDTILNAMKKLDEQAIKVLFIVSGHNRLISTLTDGDIRRAILKGISLESPVCIISNNSPITADELTSYSEIDEIMKKKGICAIPVVDTEGCIIRILYSGNSVVKSTAGNMSNPVVIMAGGKGTRLYPYTKVLPKPLIPVNDIPICERILNSFIEVGCKQFYMVVNYKKNMIKAYFADKELNCELEFVDENTPLGTGGGLKLLNTQINETFILTNCDILVVEDVKSIVDHHIKEKNDVTMVCSLKDFVIPYGTVEFSEGGEIIAFNEKPHMNFFTNTGYYIVEPCIMDYIGDNEEIGMPDIIDRMRKAGKKVGIYPISENSWLDMGQFETMDGMERRLRQLESNIDNCIGV